MRVDGRRAPKLRVPTTPSTWRTLTERLVKSRLCSVGDRTRGNRDRLGCPAVHRDLDEAAFAAALGACARDRTNHEAETSVDVAKGEKNMNHVALLVRLESRPGKEADVEAFLKGGLPIVEG